MVSASTPIGIGATGCGSAFLEPFFRLFRLDQGRGNPVELLGQTIHAADKGKGLGQEEQKAQTQQQIEQYHLGKVA